MSRSVVIAQPGKDVFAYLADARNDPKWCPKVLSVEQIEGDEPGPGARYRVTHRPIPFRPAREMDDTCVSWAPPNRIQWREEDGTDVLIVIYTLENLGGATRLTQHSDVERGAPRVLHPLMRLGIAHDIARQLKTLKTNMEAQELGSSSREHLDDR